MAKFSEQLPRRLRNKVSSAKDVSGPLPPGDRVSLSAVAQQCFRSPDPKIRFEALLAHHLSELRHLVACGASYAEVQMHLTLAFLLDEAKYGNYSNPMWPERKLKHRPQSSFDKSSAFGFLMALIACKKELDACEDDQACSRAATDVDNHLKCDGLSLEQWAPPYRSKHRESGLKLMDGDKRAHALTKRLVNWFRGETPGFYKKYALGGIADIDTLKIWARR